MNIDVSWFWAFLLVFVRCGALMLAAPFLGAQSVPVRVRVLTAAALALCLVSVVKPLTAPVPATTTELAQLVAYEALAGVLIGAMFNLVLQAIQLAGSLADLQIGLGSSQVLNPVSGVSVTVIAQFKYMLALIIFVTVDAHHTVIEALVASYSAAPLRPEAIASAVTNLMQSFSLLAIQIAAPLIAVSFVVDAALGLVNKAVPTMQVFFVGMPAKILIGMVTISLVLPAIVAGVRSGVELASQQLVLVFGGAS
jgi:flagellar biosynthesis protein FliR